MRNLLLPSEACDVLGIHRDTLIRWSSQGLLNPEREQPLGWRFYDRAEVERLKLRIRKNRRNGESLLLTTQ